MFFFFYLKHFSQLDLIHLQLKHIKYLVKNTEDL